jgi:DNA-directed RNA polymerase specialized sigma24 family protein
VQPASALILLWTPTITTAIPTKERTLAAPERDVEFTEYVQAKTRWLRGIAFLPGQDWHRADDLCQSPFLKLYLNWERADRSGSLDGYVRTILVNTFYNEQLSPW